jgi:hypothetical protein
VCFSSRFRRGPRLRPKFYASWSAGYAFSRPVIVQVTNMVIEDNYHCTIQYRCRPCPPPVSDGKNWLSTRSRFLGGSSASDLRFCGKPLTRSWKAGMPETVQERNFNQNASCEHVTILYLFIFTRECSVTRPRNGEGAERKRKPRAMMVQCGEVLPYQRLSQRPHEHILNN